MFVGQLLKEYKGRDFLIYKTIRNLYPDLEESTVVKMLGVFDILVEGFSNICEEKKELPPVVEIILKYDDAEGYIYGVYKNYVDDRLELLSKTWFEWMFLKIDSDFIYKISPCELISHILYEMTFFGFTEKQVNENIEKYLNNAFNNTIVDEDNSEGTKEQERVPEMKKCACGVECKSTKRITKNIKSRVEYLRKKNHHSFAVIAGKTGLTVEKVKKIWNEVK